MTDFSFARPGYTLFTGEDGPFWWKDCKTEGCSNQVCTWLSNSLCYPCTMAKVTGSVKVLENVNG